MTQRAAQAVWLGEIEYGACLALQREMAARRAAGEIPDTLLLLEHPPTITLGRGADRAHLRLTPESLARAGVALHETDRGGDVTYHGPGQLVGYPIIALDDSVAGRDIHAYLRLLEETLIRALAAFGIEAGRFPGYTGVWVGREKIAAIGVQVRRWVTLHGFALNVCPNLTHFDYIVPCGIRDYGVTSLERLLNRPATVQETLTPILQAFAQAFEL